MEEDKIRNIIQDHRTIVCYDSLSANQTYPLPPLSESQGRSILFINNTDYTLTLNQLSNETVNGYATDIIINQKCGWWELIAGKTQWTGITNGLSTIYEVSTEIPDTGLALDGTWDDVSVDGGTNPMTILSGIYGKGKLYSYARQIGGDSSFPTNTYLHWGIGKTSENNAPDIQNNGAFGLEINGANISNLYLERHLPDDFDYESDGSAIYMKAMIDSAESPATAHQCRGTTNCPMYMRFKRFA